MKLRKKEETSQNQTMHCRIASSSWTNWCFRNGRLVQVWEAIISVIIRILFIIFLISEMEPGDTSPNGNSLPPLPPSPHICGLILARSYIIISIITYFMLCYVPLLLSSSPNFYCPKWARLS